MKLFIIILLTAFSSLIFPQIQTGVQIARLKYSGGGDWYNDPGSEQNLLKYINSNTNVPVNYTSAFAEAGSSDIFNYPFLFMTGHGNINFSDQEAENLRTYCEKGGFLYVDDDYGLDKSFRREIKKIFPEKDLQELPFNYGLYHCFYDFNSGVPKIHEHDNKPPQGYGLFLNGKLVLLYTYESNPSDGWADPEVHNDPPEIREKALQFGTNLIIWVLTE